MASDRSTQLPPLVVAIEMGYGHLRAAWPLADAFGTEVLEIDRPPLASPAEQIAWKRSRQLYETFTRISQAPGMGKPLRRWLDDATEIPPLFPSRDLSSPAVPSRLLDQLTVRIGLGRGLAETMRSSGRALLTTFFAPALCADRLGCSPVFCVVTDSDINRVWAPLRPAESRITYFAPSDRVVRRLRAYGVPEDRVIMTGFPLPGELLGGPDLPVLKANLAQRLVRLDPERTFARRAGPAIERALGPLPEQFRGRPPLVTFAVGGAGAQTELVRKFLPGLRDSIRSRRLRLALVAGVRSEVARRFHAWISELELDDVRGDGIRILYEPDPPKYFRAFNALLAETDVLWSKPSEIAFFGALGIPLVISRPVGRHERYNRRWAIEYGAGLRQRKTRHAGEWLLEWLADGALAASAWAGFTSLPKDGLYRIVDHVRNASTSS